MTIIQDRAALLEQVQDQIWQIISSRVKITGSGKKATVDLNGSIGVVAEFALSLAEETRREDVQRCRDLQASGDAFEGEGNSKAWARAAESLANQMEARPITLAPTQETNHG